MKIKNIVFYCVLLCIAYILLEVFSFGLYFFVYKKAFKYPADYDVKIGAAAKWDVPQNLHPYFGFIATPDDKNKDSVSDFGFIDSKQPIQARSNDKVVIGIFGGSVAVQLFQNIDGLRIELEKSPYFANKKIVFLNFGIFGYKQPQQLLILDYILALGGEFDIVINLDGFNETALPAAENIPNNVFPFFPRSWHLRIIDHVIDDDHILTMGKIVRYREFQKTLNRVFSSSPLRYSVTANVLLESFNSYMAYTILESELKLLEMKEDNKRYARTGPARRYKNDEDMYQDLAAFWKNCSIQMSKICGANNIRYFHFLQPCQYVPNSKIIKAEEAKMAILENSPYKEPIEKGYPYLRRSGKELVEQGVLFTDLTMIFASNDEVLYSDNCSHFNAKGLFLLGEAIGKSIDGDIEKSNLN